MNDNKQCSFLCFKQCGDKYDHLILKKDIEGVQKLSLKKLSNNLREQQKYKMKKTSSCNRLQRYKCATDRSKQDTSCNKQYDVYRKRAQIQKQILQINESMNMMNRKYKMKLKMLEDIKEQLGQMIKYQ